jgi:Holliday junction resolvase RusA-like endonuclease
MREMRTGNQDASSDRANARQADGYRAEVRAAHGLADTGTAPAQAEDRPTAAGRPAAAMGCRAVMFDVPGEPQGKGRARQTANGRMYTPAKTVAYQGLIAVAAQQAMRGWDGLLTGPCRLDVEIVCSVPASWSRAKRLQALTGAIRPAKKPDADNVVKAICDGINGVVWHDDVQAVEGQWTKVYGDKPMLRVMVAEIEQ